MKRIFSIVSALLMTAGVWAQSPEKMSYQAVVRDASNTLVVSQSVGMQISILQGSVSGTAVYVETQTPSTNANGLVSIEIGEGTVVSGTFSTIDWANDSYFIKTETDPAGGTSYSIAGTSQLLSVPYALHAKTAETVTGTITETDPVFDASVASGITSADTTNWNNKLDSYSESDPIFGASIANGITEADTTKWNNNADTQNERIYFSAYNANNNTSLPSWTSGVYSNKINTIAGESNKIQVEEAGLYSVICSAGFFTDSFYLSLYKNGVCGFYPGEPLGGNVLSASAWGIISMSWSIQLAADDIIEIIGNGAWDGAAAGGSDNITMVKIDSYLCG